MSWNNVIPAQYLATEKARSFEIENPAITIPNDLVTDCLVQYSWEGCGTITSHDDHPAFTKLRKLLHVKGYISIPEYACWNGDRVLKRFNFNGFQLEPGNTFYCAGAWAAKIAVRDKKCGR
jgi:hypothetical protein